MGTGRQRALWFRSNELGIQMSSLRMHLYSSAMERCWSTRVGKQIRKNTMQEMKEMVDAIGKSKCIVVDGPWNPAQSMKVLSTLHCRGIAYPDGLLGGDSACERIDAFRSGKTDVASVNEQTDTNPHDEIEQQVDEPWVIVINQQFAHPFFMPYTSEAEAVRACSMLRKAWSEFKSKQTTKGEKPSGINCVL